MSRKLILAGMIIAAAAVSIALAAAYVTSAPGKAPPGNNNDILSPAPNSSGTGNGTFRVIPDSDLPEVADPDVRVEKVIEGLELPTSMAFLDRDDMLILQKDNGMVRLVSNGTLLENPALDVPVESRSERGLLGVAVSNNTSNREVFLYYTEDDGEVRNRVYRYNLTEGSLTGGTIILDLPGTPGPNHDGGKITIGPDGMLYAVIGDLNRDGMLQNYPDGPEPDDTSVILRVDREGNGVNGTLSGEGDALERYYAYGIRNSFGLDFDPLTGTLWDTENGPSNYDEINVVMPGFNSGWERVMGPIDRSGMDESGLVELDGSHYADPVFSWRDSRGVTDIEFFNSTALGNKYADNIFVGDINSGNLYYFKVNESRDGISLDNISDPEGREALEDRVADINDEVEHVIFGIDFGGITDIETGPDGYLYILSIEGSVYRLVPSAP